jgi:hypothetical protein
VLERQNVTDDILLAYQVAQKHVVRRISKDMANSKYGLWSGFNGLLYLETVVQTSCLKGVVRSKKDTPRNSKTTKIMPHTARY